MCKKPQCQFSQVMDVKQKANVRRVGENQRAKKSQQAVWCGPVLQRGVNILK